MYSYLQTVYSIVKITPNVNYPNLEQMYIDKLEKYKRNRHAGCQNTYKNRAKRQPFFFKKS